MALPDASVSPDIVAKDISSLATIGAGGLEFLPFYLYGLVYANIGATSAAPNSVAPPTDWSIYGFGDEAFNLLFKNALQAVKAAGNEFVIDFALGPNQGAGVPSVPGTKGLAVHLVPGNATVTPGQSFSGSVPRPYLPAILRSGLGFQIQLEDFGTPNLTALFAMKVIGNATKTIFEYGTGETKVPVVILDEDSYVDLAPFVSADGQLEWTPPTSGDTSTWKIFTYWQQYTNQRECHGGLNPATVIGNGSWIVDHFSSAGAQKVTNFWDEHILTDDETAELLASVGKYDLLKAIPSVDVPECESLGFEDSLTSYRQFSGPAHLTGHNVISSEMGAVPGPAYNLTIPQLLFHAKRGLAGGVTQHVLHGSPYSGNYPNTTWPGYTPFYYEFSEQWTPHLPVFGSGHLKDTMDWIGRNQWVLQQGKPKIDLAVYYYTVPWAPGDEDVLGGADGLGALGYTYDYLGPENLLLPQATVTEGILAADGPAYKALLLFGQQIITMEAAQVVLRFAEAGLPVLVIGGTRTLPEQRYASRGAKQEPFATVMSQLANSSSVQFLNSISGLSGAFSQLGLEPRIGVNCTSNPVYPVLRSDVDNGTEYVWLYNDQESRVDCTISFTSAGNGVVTPFVYDAVTGTQEELVRYTADGATFTLPVSLAGNETVILAFKSSFSNSTSKKSSVTSSSRNVASIRRTSLNTSSGHSVLASITSSGSAEITFDSGKTVEFDISLPAPTSLRTWDIDIEDWHAPADLFDVEAGTSITVHRFKGQALVPWASLGPGFENVSGVGRYTTQFAVTSLPYTNTTPAGTTRRIGAFLSLGPPVFDTVRVSIDGVQLPPIDPVKPVTDISSYIGETGQEHELAVEVTTTLFNRVRSMADEVMVWGQVAAVRQPLYASEEPYDYGLLGPVIVQWVALVGIDIDVL
ncbi:hypothetical protein SLS53_008382 [Cytospora paraplurivora]|uniref:Secreted protein n=1 Tax=Cytospora paraplurivora TaxID=2898453 RepID=A0AAN9YD42_9PEZI